jgi:predicted TIM-barrel fold metal-dependent hydrolase
MSTQRPVIISCDGHATGRPEDYADYVEPAYRDRYADFVEHLHGVRMKMEERRENDEGLFSKQGADAFDEATGDDRDGEWNSSVRTRVLEQEGVVAEVLFPNGGVPFGGFGETANDHELRHVGNRAYDRWLLDFANDLPGRRGALAMLAVADIEACIAEINWAADNGFVGVIAPTEPGEGLPPWLDPCYDPIWAACQDTELAVHFHAGGGTPDYGNYGMASMLMYATETTYFGRRPLFSFMWGGVFERFPRLQLVLTENRADWVPDTLKLLDGIHRAPFFSHAREALPLTPSEYWNRQIWVAASFMGADESALRHEIGLGHLMWGADYPHVEGTWPKTKLSLSRCFAGIPAAEMQQILEGNPAQLYGFDVAALQEVADRIESPTAAELTGV